MQRDGEEQGTRKLYLRTPGLYRGQERGIDLDCYGLVQLGDRNYQPAAILSMGHYTFQTLKCPGGHPHPLSDCQEWMWFQRQAAVPAELHPFNFEVVDWNRLSVKRQETDDTRNAED